MQEALEADEVLVVVVVEGGGGLQVQRRQVVVPGAGGARAVRLPLLGKRGVDVGVVVDVSPEGRAPC